MDKTKSGLRDYWDGKLAEATAAREQGLCIINVRPTRSERRVNGSVGHINIIQEKCRIHVICPYNGDFRKGALELIGRWKPRSGVWTFNPHAYRLVLELCIRVYGKDKVQITGKRHLVEGK